MELTKFFVLISQQLWAQSTVAVSLNYYFLAICWHHDGKHNTKTIYVLWIVHPETSHIVLYISVVCSDRDQHTHTHIDTLATLTIELLLNSHFKTQWHLDFSHSGNCVTTVAVVCQKLVNLLFLQMFRTFCLLESSNPNTRFNFLWFITWKLW